MKQVDILTSKNQVLQILYFLYKTLWIRNVMKSMKICSSRKLTTIYYTVLTLTQK